MTKNVTLGNLRKSTEELFDMCKDVDQLFDNFMEHLNRSDDEKRAELLKRIHQSRELVKETPDNLWFVYELCKDIYDLAELDRVDFNGASYVEKLNLIRLIVPFAGTEEVQEGVAEYHESRKQNSWTMHYLREEQFNDDRSTV